MWLAIAGFLTFAVPLVVGRLLALRTKPPAGDRRTEPRAPCVFRSHGTGAKGGSFPGNLSSTGAMVVLPWPACSSMLAVEALVPGRQEPMVLAGAVVSAEEVEGPPAGFAYHLRLDPNFRGPELDEVVRQLGT